MTRLVIRLRLLVSAVYLCVRAMYRLSRCVHGTEMRLGLLLSLSLVSVG